MKKIICTLSFVILALVLVACGKSKTHLVVVNYNNGNNSLVKLTETIEKPDTPIYEGYEFEGWFVGDKPYTFEEALSEDLVIEAKWSKIQPEVKPEAKTFKVIFDAGEGIVIEPQMVTEGKGAFNVVPKKEGYYFDGWYKDKTLKQSINLADGIFENLTLYAKWEEQPSTDKTITITFVYNQDDLENTTQTVSINKKAKAYAPKREGYRFIGWCYNQNLSDEAPLNKLQNVVFGKDTILYAKWELL